MITMLQCFANRVVLHQEYYLHRLEKKIQETFLVDKNQFFAGVCQNDYIITWVGRAK